MFACSGGLPSGDISPNYSSLDSHTIRSIARGLPNAKFLMLVREPLQRLWSALCMKARNGRIRPADLKDWERLRVLLKDANLATKSRQSAVWSR